MASGLLDEGRHGGYEFVFLGNKQQAYEAKEWNSKMRGDPATCRIVKNRSYRFRLFGKSCGKKLRI